MPGYLMCLIWTAFTIAALAWVLCAALLASGEIFSPSMMKTFFERLGNLTLKLESYAEVWDAQNVNVYFLNSLIYTVISCVCIILVAAPAAYALSRFRFPGNALIHGLIAAALGIPSIMIIMPLFSLAASIGMTNTRPVIIILYVAMNVPFTIFFLLASFKNLSFTFEEAAAMDGCGPIGTFWRIMFPLARPGIITVTVFNFITIWNEFFLSMIFVNEPSVRPVAVGLYDMVQSMRDTGDWGGMFASVVIACAPPFVLYLFLGGKIISGVTGGTIKG